MASLWFHQVSGSLRINYRGEYGKSMMWVCSGIFLDCALPWSWEAMHIFKMMPLGVGSFSTIDSLILRTFYDIRQLKSTWSTVLFDFLQLFGNWWKQLFYFFVQLSGNLQKLLAPACGGHQSNFPRPNNNYQGCTLIVSYRIFGHFWDRYLIVSYRIPVV